MRDSRRLVAGVWLAGALMILATGITGLWGTFDTPSAQAAADPLDITFDERLMLTTPSGAEVTLVSKSAGYSNTFGMQSPTAGDIFSCDVPYGTTVSLGVFAPGELVFRLKTPPGYTYFTGPPSVNPDSVLHADLVKVSPTVVTINWEDLYGGGDLDYNDCVVDVVVDPIEADVKVTSVVTTCTPSPASVGVPFTCTVTGTVHNNGPAGPVNTDINHTLTPPPGCTITPAGGQPSPDVVLDVSVATPISKTWTVTCSQPSNHSFTGRVTITLDQPGKTDPDGSNNAVNGATTTTVTALADLKKQSVAVVSAPPQINVSQTVPITVQSVIHNNGPYGPVTAQDVSFAIPPPDCTASTPAPQSGSMAVSVPITLNVTINIHCTRPSNHVFQFCDDVQITQLHVADPDPTNNRRCVTHTIVAVAQADLKKTGATVVNPPASIPVSQTVPITVASVVHNNGPYGPVNARDTFFANVPPDCTVASPAPVTLSLAVSVPQTITTTYNVHCTAPSNHTIQFCNIVSVLDLHVTDPNPGNDRYCVTHTVTAIATADLKKTGATVVNPPASIPVSQTVPFTVASVVHNNGPYGPVNARDTFFANVPPDCTVASPAPVTLPLAVSVPQTITTTYNVHCTAPSNHTIQFCNIVSVLDLHVIDPNPGNDRYCVTHTVTAVAQADVKKTSVVVVNPPAEINVSETVSVQVDSVVHNNGPYGPVNVTDIPFAIAPPDCTAVPNGGPIGLPLPVSVPTTVSTSYDIHCTSPSDHTFQFCDDVQIEDLHVVDPDPTNNRRCVTYTVAAVARADVKKESVTVVNPPAQINVSETASVQVDSVIHNNGPHGPVNVTDIPFAIAPPDCTAVPNGGPIGLPLPVSVPTTVSTSYDIHCTSPSDHTFQFCDDVQIEDLHVIDPDPTNNRRCVSYTVVAIATADLKKVDVTVNGPPQIVVSQTVPINVSSVIHNNGPWGPVTGADTFSATAPPDCTVGGGSSADVPLPASVPVTLAEVFTIHCTAPSNHTFQFCNEIEVADLHIVDPDPSNNQICVDYTVVAIADADVKKASWGVGVPPTADVSEDVIAGWGIILHNNGPYGPVDVDDLLAATSVPPDCTVDPPAIDMQDLGLPVSSGLAIDGFFTIHCTSPSDHTFEFCDTLSIDEVHVEDPDPSNNGGCQTYTTAFTAEADLKVQNVAVDCPANADAGTPFTCTVQTTVHNNGPYGPVNADVSTSLSGPADCTFSPAGAQGQQDLSLAVSVSQTVTKSWQVTCTDRSNHQFTATGTVTPDQVHVVDPNTTNNSNTGNDTVAVFQNADVKVQDVTVTCDEVQVQIGLNDYAQGQLVNTPFDCDVTASIHNNGPVTPVNADVTVSLSGPFDCTLAPSGNQSSPDVSLPASTTVTITKTWSVSCSTYSFHLFTGSASVDVDQLHVKDPVSSNNSQSGQDTVPVWAGTDVKMTGITVTAPPSANAGNPFTVSIDVTIHNNGPVTPLQGEGGIGIAAPSDCVVNPSINPPNAGYQLFNPVPIPLSVTVTQTKSWTVTCTDSGEHEFIACGRVGPVTEHVFDSNILNNQANQFFTVDVGNSPVIPVTVTCSILGDPPEECGNGIDEDQDGLIDEEPDPDGDGLSSCVDSDDDGDGYTDAVEDYVGTDPSNACPNHQADSAWPPDFNNSRSVNVSDVLNLKPSFGSSSGSAGYSQRSDLTGNGSVNITDVLNLKPRFGTNCQ